MSGYLLKFKQTYSVKIGGRRYPVVKIGNQLWMAENLDWKFEGCVIGASGTSTSESRANYYDNDETTYGVNGKKYGLLYNYYAANYIEQNKSTMLPTGWHLPSTTEWNTLFSFVGNNSVAGKKLKSMTDWSSGTGTDDYGFNLLPAGLYWGSFGSVGTINDLWTSTNTSNNGDYIRFSTENSVLVSFREKGYGYSIRLVKSLT